MKLKNLSAIILALSFLFSLSLPLLSEEEITPQKSNEIIEKIRSLTIPMYKKYRGIQSRKIIQTKEFEFDRIVTSTTVEVNRKEFFYDDYPETVVIKYEKNGNLMKPSDYKEKKYLPMFPVFDEKDTEYYSTSVTGYETIEGKKCYRIKVIPKENTIQHFKGNLYFTVQNLKLVMMEGTFGKLPPACKDFIIKTYFDHQNDITVERESSVNIQIVIPLLYDGELKSFTTVTECKPILR